MEGKAVFGGGQGKGGEADNKLNIDSIIARLLEGDLHSQNSISLKLLEIELNFKFGFSLWTRRTLEYSTIVIIFPFVVVQPPLSLFIEKFSCFYKSSTTILRPFSQGRPINAI